MSSIFGAKPQNPTGGGVFGSTLNTKQPTGGGLFGSNANAGSGGSLFGSTANNNNSAPQAGASSLFGANNTQNSGNTGGGGSLFGNNNQNTGNSGGLFGASTAQPSGGGGLFGTNTNTNQATAGSSLFGNQSAAKPATETGALFGNAPNAAPPQNSSSLFGNTAGNTGQNTASSVFGNKPSLFGNATQSAQNSLFGSTAALAQPQNQPPQQQQQQQQQSTSSLFGLSNASIGVGQGGHQLTPAQMHRLQYSGYSTLPNEKSVLDQIRTIAGKWTPTDENNILKTYFYNAVEKAYAPFFYPNASNGEDEKSWEDALSRKPEMPKVPGGDGAGMAYVPTLCRGFEALGSRVHTQARAVQDMRARLHEMNNSLSAVMDAHQQRITVKLAAAHKQHRVLAQRCLALAAKVQVLRNRGYALDAAEEGLRRTLLGLESQVLDAGFAGREDEIWARMVALRERARWLEEEGKRVAAQVVDSQAQQAGPAATEVSEDVLAKTRKILKDYDDQLGHLGKELEDIKKEYAEWEATQKR